MSNTTSTTNVNVMNKEFRFKAEQELSASSIVMDRIENSSGPHIAKSIIDAMLKKGKAKQWRPTDATGRPLQFHRVALPNGVDPRNIAYVGVCMSRILPHLDTWRSREMIETMNFTWKQTFRNIARANKGKHGAEFIWKEADTKESWLPVVNWAFKMCIEANLIEVRHTDGVEEIRHTQKYLGSMISRKAIRHQHEPITMENRRKERVKGQFQPKKDNTSAETRRAAEYIESQATILNEDLFNGLQFVVESYRKADCPLPKVLATAEHILAGCSDLVGKKGWSEYFHDPRGRFYQFAHAGPNPQGADLAKALQFHDVENFVDKGSLAYDMFMLELETEVLNGDKTWLEESKIRYAAANPGKTLMAVFQKNEGQLPFKKFFTYLTMCKYWVDFEDNGRADVRLGFGPDAKTSGAQILSILAGSEEIAKACGLTTEERGTDTYGLSAIEMSKLIEEHEDFSIMGLKEFNRDDVKTPFMAVQYGGGAPALMENKKFIKCMLEHGVPEHKLLQFVKEIVVEGIQKALGDEISAFISGVREAVARKLQEENKFSFSYRHINGFKCTQRGSAESRMTDEAFRITLPEENASVIFGSLESETGWAIPSSIEADLHRENFVYYFIVHYVQGLDAVMAMKIADRCRELGLRGYSTIHDQFRVCLADAPRMMTDVLPHVYREMFINNDPVAQLEKQLGQEISGLNPLEPRKQIVTEEILASANAFYFE